jgi:hypothetical protein
VTGRFGAYSLLVVATQMAVLPFARAQTGTPGPSFEDAHGVQVTISSNDPGTELYLGRGDLPSGPFERIGVVPRALRLAPGTYTLETAAPNASTGHQRFAVEAGAPVTIEVRSGNATVRGFGSVFIGLGIVATILGVLAIVSISPNDQNYNRFGIGLPLILGGAAGAGLGVGMTALGSTEVRARSTRAEPTQRAQTPSMPAFIWRF